MHAVYAGDAANARTETRWAYIMITS
jgi:hypothetical protein